ncbi:MAG TPA: aconitate hydratase AcnA, partial [Thermoanaerobaculia bacterium]|nr:aconitate hydratase AcnA [Thermoanaerobaculia bacterium]
VAIFPIDDMTLEYLRLTGRDENQIALVEGYAKAQGLFRTAATPDAVYTESCELDLGTVEPSLAGPRRPQDRVRLSDVKPSFLKELEIMKAAGHQGRVARPAPGMQLIGGTAGGTAVAEPDVTTTEADAAAKDVRDGSVVIAAITSCTNTSNPSVMVAAGLLAKKAVEKGLQVKPWVKTSLAPGSKVVTEYLREAGLTPYLDQLRFNLVGYGCTTCIGNSGPLPTEISRAIDDRDLVAAAVLSGNRNFEGRINSDVRANYLASPPLVVAYALAGRIDVDLQTEPLGTGKDGQPVYLKDVWPSRKEVEETVLRALRAEMFQREYRDVYAGDERWNALEIPEGDTYEWDPESTYVRLPPYFEDMPAEPKPAEDVKSARVLGLFGDSITTDHISPAGSIKAASPAGKYLQEHGVAPKDCNYYGARRGNHEVMMRGTFANVRLRNRLVPEIEGGFTLHLPDGEPLPIYDAAMKYQAEGVPTVILAGKEYGTGSSRDWAAKGPRLLGVRAVIAETFERIHRSNLVGMGVMPLEFVDGQNADSLGLTGREVFDITGLAAGVANGFASDRQVSVRATADDGKVTDFQARVRLDTPQEIEYYRHGGILHYVLRQLLRG